MVRTAAAPGCEAVSGSPTSIVFHEHKQPLKDDGLAWCLFRFSFLVMFHVEASASRASSHPEPPCGTER